MAQDELNFLSFLQGFRRGELIRRGEEALDEVMQGIRATGGKGEITVKLPFNINKAGQIECTPTVTAKVPSRPVGTGIYFMGDEGQLSRRDPAQMDIEDEIEKRRVQNAAE